MNTGQNSVDSQTSWNQRRFAIGEHVTKSHSDYSLWLIAAQLQLKLGTTQKSHGFTRGSVTQQADSPFSNRWSVGSTDSPQNPAFGDVCPWSALTEVCITLVFVSSVFIVTLWGSSFPETVSWKRVLLTLGEGQESFEKPSSRPFWYICCRGNTCKLGQYSIRLAVCYLRQGHWK